MNIGQGHYKVKYVIFTYRGLLAMINGLLADKNTKHVGADTIHVLLFVLSIKSFKWSEQKSGLKNRIDYLSSMKYITVGIANFFLLLLTKKQLW